MTKNKQDLDRATTSAIKFLNSHNEMLSSFFDSRKNSVRPELTETFVKAFYGNLQELETHLEALPKKKPELEGRERGILERGIDIHRHWRQVFSEYGGNLKDSYNTNTLFRVIEDGAATAEVKNEAIHIYREAEKKTTESIIEDYTFWKDADVPSRATNPKFRALDRVFGRDSGGDLSKIIEPYLVKIQSNDAPDIEDAASIQSLYQKRVKEVGNNVHEDIHTKIYSLNSTIESVLKFHNSTNQHGALTEERAMKFYDTLRELENRIKGFPENLWDMTAKDRVPSSTENVLIYGTRVLTHWKNIFKNHRGTRNSKESSSETFPKSYKEDPEKLLKTIKNGSLIADVKTEIVREHSFAKQKSTKGIIDNYHEWQSLSLSANKELSVRYQVLNRIFEGKENPLVEKIKSHLKPQKSYDLLGINKKAREKAIKKYYELRLEELGTTYKAPVSPVDNAISNMMDEIHSIQNAIASELASIVAKNEGKIDLNADDFKDGIKSLLKANPQDEKNKGRAVRSLTAVEKSLLDKINDLINRGEDPSILNAVHAKLDATRKHLNNKLSSEEGVKELIGGHIKRSCVNDLPFFARDKDGSLKDLDPKDKKALSLQLASVIKLPEDISPFLSDINFARNNIAKPAQKLMAEFFSNEGNNDKGVCTLDKSKLRDPANLKKFGDKLSSEISEVISTTLESINQKKFASIAKKAEISEEVKGSIRTPSIPSLQMPKMPISKVTTQKGIGG